MNDWHYLRKLGKPMTPANYGVEEAHIALWRRFLKKELLMSRGRKCEACKKKHPGVIHLHEGIVKQGEISKSVDGWWEIFSEYNCFLVCGPCHGGKSPLQREGFHARSQIRYGADTVDDWLDSLPFKELRLPRVQVGYV